jgi:predicted tellurium resistance membrane protein TerC
LDSLLKSVLKRQMPYPIGGTITGTIMAYYYGFLFAIIVNSIIWFVISTLFNKFYWKYTGFKEEFQLISKYIARIKKKKSNSNFVTKGNEHEEGQNISKYSYSNNKGDDNKTDNSGSPLKF